MKYIVITSKHHDGFALYDSKVSPFDVVDATPFKRDILKELAAACQKRGMRLGFYYSQAQDWHEPERHGQHLGLRPRREEGLRPVPSRQGRAPSPRDPDRLRAGRPRLVRHAPPDDARAGQALHRHRPHDPAELPDRRPSRSGRRLRLHRRQLHPRRGPARGLGDARHHQPHLGLPQGRSRLEVARRHRLQAGRHREQGRQLPAERRPHGRRRHPPAQPGQSACRRAVAEEERRGRLRHGGHPLGRRAGREELERRDGPARQPALPAPATSGG